MIGANGITLDLNGYLIDGDGTEFAACHAREHCDFGVFNDGHDGVTVMHGSVREFEAGAFAQSARHNRLLVFPRRGTASPASGSAAAPEA